MSISKNIQQNQYISQLNCSAKNYTIFDINKLSQKLELDIHKLPYSLRILLENLLRNNADESKLLSFKTWLIDNKSDAEIPFMPTRVLMQDFTGIPAVVDLASMRDAMRKLNRDPLKINPVVPVDLVIDHSVQVDFSSTNQAFAKNVQLEMHRNFERYQFLKWGQLTFDNFRVVPPGTGICHQVNLEYLAKIIWTKKLENGSLLAYPDSIVGTDSHTTMINALSILGWGVGGIEAESAMLGYPISMILPEVVGVKLTGTLNPSVNATDLVLTITEILRRQSVVGKFVEFYGDALQHISLADRATIANMAPEYGATCGFFPIDEQIINYLKLTGRDSDTIELVEKYSKSQSIWYDGSRDAHYSNNITIDLSQIETCLAGPKRPQDRVSLGNVGISFQSMLPNKSFDKYQVPNKEYTLSHGDVVIAAITSCTNTSNPKVMIASALLAKKACNLGIKTKPWVKKSLAPGSQVVTQYLRESGLDVYLDELGFNLVGYGCTTCIGNSGPLDKDIEKTIISNDLVVNSVLSGNRNFEGRINPLVKANYLASPPLVVAYAIAGNMIIDISKQPIAQDEKGCDVYLQDLWPTNDEIDSILSIINKNMFLDKYNNVFTGDHVWQNLSVSKSATYDWNANSTYIKEPPYFHDIQKSDANALKDIICANVLLSLGDSVTTDHISPAGNISLNSTAGQYLLEHGVSQSEFNSYGARRGNHEVMIRGTFANIRIRNELCPGTEGGIALNAITKKQASVYDVAMSYKQRSIPSVIFAGKEYGTGSSRDWAAKGTLLLGIKVVIAESFERIHRSNLVGMGVLPMTFANNMTRKDLNLTGYENLSIYGIDNNVTPYQKVKAQLKNQDGQLLKEFELKLQIFTNNEMLYLKHGGILNNVIKNS
ncbi:MAG: aconitate hydratase AcnA [Rickettsiaceae bacterium]